MDFGKVNVTMSTDEAIRIKNLLNRDEERAVIKVNGTYENGKPFSFFRCPVCESVILDGAKFCSKCGQKVDTENYAF